MALFTTSPLAGKFLEWFAAGVYTWNVPPGVTSVDLGIMGGGGGGAGQNGADAGGGGGAGYPRRWRFKLRRLLK